MAKPRLQDVAAVAGVSMKTVSNVVHGYAHVSPTMRARVQAAIDELGYKPHLTARRLATGRTGMIALAIPEIDHPYFSELARNIAEEAGSRGLRVLIEQTLSDAGAEHAVLHDREAGLVDGVVFHPVSTTAAELAGIPADSPLVLLGEAARPAGVDHVMIDNVGAAAAATRHLLALGRHRIAFAAAVDDDITVSTAERMTGYRAALRNAGIEPDPALVLRSRDFTIGGAAHALASALDTGLDLDGVLARDDKFALGTLEALRAAGRRVPEDVAVVGWDDTVLASHTTPALTSVSPDKGAIAALALDLLAERIVGLAGPGRHRLAPYRIVVRHSAPEIG